MRRRLHVDGHVSTEKRALSASSLCLALCFMCGSAIAADIHDAVKTGDVAAAKVLLESGPKQMANATLKGGITPLHIAAVLNQSEMASLLLARGANVNASTDSGFTPLHYAALKGAQETAEVLIKQRRRKLSAQLRAALLLCISRLRKMRRPSQGC